MKRYTISKFLNVVMGALIVFVCADLLVSVYMLLNGGSKLYIAVSTLLFLTGGVLLVIYLLRIQTSIKGLRKSYNEFMNGKTSSLKIMPSTHMFLTEEENLLNHINELINREELLKEANKQAEYLALQNQINPHFLYNTLEAMRGDALTSGMESLANVAQALSSFFRYTISDVQFLVTVDDELENINNYFFIQKYRFGDDLKLEINFLDDEEQIRNLRLPKLTLQPIVENSVRHGLEAQVNRGKISITFDQTETHLFISVKDSGRGMPEKELQALNDSLNETPFQSREKYDAEKEKKLKNGHTGIALKNVSQRIKLLFGDEYGIYIFSTPGVGTNVKITIPRQTQDSAPPDR